MTNKTANEERFAAKLNNIKFWMNVIAEKKFQFSKDNVQFVINGFHDNICIFDKANNKSSNRLFDKDELRFLNFIDCSYGCNKEMAYSIALNLVEIAMTKETFIDTLSSNIAVNPNENIF